MLLRVMFMASRSILKLLADTGAPAVLPTASTISPAACKPVSLLQCLLKASNVSYIIGHSFQVLR